jgi:alanyl-tRNA synthetase
VKSAHSIRREFIAFFEEKGHKFVRSAPVVPQNDPTLLFTNAGMNQFKDVFLGTGARDYKRAVNSQKCIRASGKHNDLEDVGRDNYHHTFFEMLGNWSFGDYFKREAIAWAWELLVERWRLDPRRLYATVFGGNEEEGLVPDTESERLWTEVTPLAGSRVMRFGKEENFWEMGETGPCGPCSEIHYDLGEGACPRAAEAGHRCGVNAQGCWRFMELWNLVFIQFNRDGAGTLEPLPARHVDTGMGLERIARVLQKKDSNYATDLFTPLIAAIEEITGRQDAPGEPGVAMRVIADHLRALSFAIADGAIPSNEGRGYVLRRMLRRAARFGRVLEMKEPFAHRLVPALVKRMGQAFPELKAQERHIAQVIRAEEESFGHTLDRGLEIFARIAAEMATGARREFPGEEAFKLYDTYGFPVDLTRLMAEERGFMVDMSAFNALMEAQRAKGKAASQGAGSAEGWVVVSEGPDSAFTGYQSLEEETAVRRHRRREGGLDIVLERTPFYPEGGGQVGDQGWIDGAAGEWRVVDTIREGDRILHLCEPATPVATVPDGRPVRARVDGARRIRTTLNHTATHLLHAALSQVLGNRVTQAGSVVHPDYLRFDYTHFEKPGEAQLEEVERLVSEQIRRNQALRIFETDYGSALKSGVIALFGEKYGDRVRVVQVDGFSSELCGGCHVRATGDIGSFKIISESSIAAGVRRIVALTGEGAEAHVRQALSLLETLKAQLNAPAEELAAKVGRLIEDKRQLERELQALRKQSLSDGAEQLLRAARSVRGVSVLASRVEAASMDELRTIADSIRQRLKTGVAVLGSIIQGKAMLLSVVSDDLVRRDVKAGEIVRLVADLAGGRGGGPPHMATGGAKDLDKLPAALEQAPQVIDTYLGRVLS